MQEGFFQRMCSITGYSPITTFWDEFTKAEASDGENAVRNLYAELFEKCKGNHKSFTELVMILNWKSWYHDSADNDQMCSLYVDLFNQASDWGYNNLKGEAMDYFWQTLD